MYRRHFTGKWGTKTGFVVIIPEGVVTGVKHQSPDLIAAVNASGHLLQIHNSQGSQVRQLHSAAAATAKISGKSKTKTNRVSFSATSTAAVCPALPPCVRSEQPIIKFNSRNLSLHFTRLLARRFPQAGLHGYGRLHECSEISESGWQLLEYSVTRGHGKLRLSW